MLKQLSHRERHFFKYLILKKDRSDKITNMINEDGRFYSYKKKLHLICLDVTSRC